MQAPKTIPDYPDYMITEDGKVFSRKTKQFLTPTCNRYVRLYNRWACRQVSTTILVEENFPSVLPALPELPPIDGRTTKIVPGFPDYAITATGKVYDRKRKCEQRPTSGGKIILVNREQRTQKSTMIAQLVAGIFIGPAPAPYTRIRHLDGNKKNNHAGNLCWIQKGYICKPCPICGEVSWYMGKYGYCVCCQQAGRYEEQAGQPMPKSDS